MSDTSFNTLSVVDHTEYITLTIGNNSINITKPITPQVNPYLTFSSPNSFTLSVVDNLKYWDGTLEYSTDTINWAEWLGTSAISSGVSGNDNVLYLRGTGNTYITGSNATSSKGHWTLTGSDLSSDISCEGNIENLLDYATVSANNHPTMASYCYRWMFYNCWKLITAPELSATTLAQGCYEDMFRNCSHLTTVPALPATTLATSCYYRMFRRCSALTTLPELPALILANTCYYRMFQECRNINLSATQDSTYTNAYRIPSDGTGTDASNSVMYMFSDTNGTFTGTPSINTTYYTSNTIIPAGGNS